MFSISIFQIKVWYKKNWEQVECLRLWWMCIGELLGFAQSKCNYSAALTYSRLSACLYLTGVQSVRYLRMLVLKSQWLVWGDVTQQLLEISIKLQKSGRVECLKSHNAVTVVFSHCGNWDGMHTGRLFGWSSGETNDSNICDSFTYTQMASQKFLLSFQSCQFIGFTTSMVNVCPPLSLSLYSFWVVILLSFEYGLCKSKFSAFKAFLWEDKKERGIRHHQTVQGMQQKRKQCSSIDLSPRLYLDFGLGGRNLLLLPVGLSLFLLQVSSQGGTAGC